VRLGLVQGVFRERFTICSWTMICCDLPAIRFWDGLRKLLEMRVLRKHVLRSRGEVLRTRILVGELGGWAIFLMEETRPNGFIQ
jgi:hypothetical protein